MPPIAPETPAISIPVKTPLVPQTPPKNPATAFDTPHKVLAWLLRAQEEGKCSIGTTGDSERCPLARFARSALGLPQAQVCCLVVETWEGTRWEGLHLRYLADEEQVWAAVPLPQWCQDFAVRVDSQDVQRISPQRALRILGEVMTNADVNSCPT